MLESLIFITTIKILGNPLISRFLNNFLNWNNFSFFWKTLDFNRTKIHHLRTPRKAERLPRIGSQRKEEWHLVTRRNGVNIRLISWISALSWWPYLASENHHLFIFLVITTIRASHSVNYSFLQWSVIMTYFLLLQKCAYSADIKAIKNVLSL